MSTYQVQSGDTLWLISQAKGISLDTLVAANPQLGGSTNLKIGEVLNLPTSSTGGPGGSRGAQQQPQGGSEQERALAAHNRARQEISRERGHQRPDLVWDNTLASHATAWAQHLAETGRLDHSHGDQRPGEGENLFVYFPSGTLTGAVDGWITEKANYSGQPIGQGDLGKYGHYTQVIWPTTTRVGLGMASGHGGVWIVGRYGPAGNLLGQSAY